LDQSSGLERAPNSRVEYGDIGALLRLGDDPRKQAPG